MDGLDYGLVGMTALVVVGTLLALLLVSLAMRRAVEVLTFGYVGGHKNKTVAWFSIFATIIGLLLGLAFWLGGGPNGSGRTLVINGYGQLYACIFLLFVGVILTFLIRLPRPKKDRTLNQKIVQHAYFAWPWRHKWIVFPALIIIAIFGVLLYQKFALDQNRAAFQQARNVIDTIYADIVKQAGQPDNFRRTNECSRPSQEFEQGPLSCDVSTDFIYGVNNKEQSDKLKYKIQNTVKNHAELLSPSPAPASDIYPTPAPGNNTDSTNEYYKTKDGMGCSIKYTYDLLREISLRLSDNSRKIFGVAFDCSDFAKQIYYPSHKAD